LIIKGVMCTGDAAAAADCGAEAVVVSNHGGRQLDGVASPVRNPRRRGRARRGADGRRRALRH
jgi:hypothetical protein